MFKKIRKFYKNNRIYCILMIISMFCILLMATCVIIYFANQLSTSNYGSRLEQMDDYKLENSLKDLEDFYKEQESVLDASTRLQGRIIYVQAHFAEGVKNEEIQNVATSSLEKLSEENRGFYDMQFIFTRDNMNPYFGSKNANNTVITWSNFTYDTEETTTTTKK